MALGDGTDPAGVTSNPRTLAVTEAPPAPATKNEALDLATDKRKEWEAYKAQKLSEGIMIDETSGKIVRLVKDEGPARPASMSDEQWEKLQAIRSLSGSSTGTTYSTIPDLEGQGLYDQWKSSELDAKDFRAEGSTARSYLSTETDKTKEIQRQYKDFEDRASLLYDLMGDEQDFAMAADDQNVANWKAQRDLGMATSPGGYYTTPYQSMTMSEILRPSLPDYVRPDYRLNESVGLPGPQGFDDPDYSPYGLPMFANGTAPLPPNFWPWPPRR